MAVPSWKRKLSSTQFLYEIFNLNVVIGRIVGNTPKKYTNSYGDSLIKLGVEAYQHANLANSIFVQDQSSYELRRNELDQAINCCATIGTFVYIYLELIKNADGLSNNKKNKIYFWEEEIGNGIANTISMMKSIKKYDRAEWNKKKENMVTEVDKIDKVENSQ